MSETSTSPAITSTATKSKASMSTEKKTAARTRKLKSSAWYEGAARSIGINKKKTLESRNDAME